MKPHHGLNPGVYLTLLAIGWIDRPLCDQERTLILRAAQRAGLEPAALDRLSDAARWPVSFEVVAPGIEGPDARYLYALASYLALIDGEVDITEDAALEALGYVLGIRGHERRVLDEVAATRAMTGDDPSQFEPDTLRSEVELAWAGGCPSTPVPTAVRPAPSHARRPEVRLF